MLESQKAGYQSSAVGIERIILTDDVSGLGAERIIKARDPHRIDAANEIYFGIFERLGSPLMPGSKITYCLKEEFRAGYDYELGIDIILTLSNGTTITLQEKILHTKYNTLTVEHMNDPSIGKLGDWFTMKAQLYFVGYEPRYDYRINPWMLVNWPQMQMNIDNIQWWMNSNKNDGARATFKYAYFKSIPSDCVIASSDDPRFNFEDVQLPLFKKD